MLHKIIPGVLIAFLLASCASPAPTPTPVPPTATLNFSATQTAEAQASSTAQAQARATSEAASATALAQIQATNTAQRAATVTAQAQQTAAPILTARAIDSYAESLANAGKKVYGPEQDVLYFSNQSFSPYSLAVRYAGISTRNSIMQARFLNPYDRTVLPWNYGFEARRSGDCQAGLYLWVNSDRKYRAGTFGKRLPTGPFQPPGACARGTEVNGTVSGLDVSPTGSNLLRLILKDKSALLYINGQYEVTVDVSDVDFEGDIGIGVAFMGDPSFKGLRGNNHYTDFTIWALP